MSQTRILRIIYFVVATFGRTHVDAFHQAREPILSRGRSIRRAKIRKIYDSSTVAQSHRRVPKGMKRSIESFQQERVYLPYYFHVFHYLKEEDRPHHNILPTWVVSLIAPMD
jgi:hypothetical protein